MNLKPSKHLPGNWILQTIRIQTVLACVCWTFVFCPYIGSTAVVAEQPHPNIVLIMVDDMGYGDPGCYNSNSQIPTPNIDGLAKRGMRFTDAHAPGPLCHLSRYGLMTGKYPFRVSFKGWSKRAIVKPDQTTVASFLKSVGYRTEMVGKWHLGFNENGYDQPLHGGPTDVGFDQFFGIRASTDIPPYFYIRDDQAIQPPTNQIAANKSDGWSPIQGAFWRKGGIAPGLQLKNVLPRFTEEAIKVIQSHEIEVPLFLYLAYPAPHTPWLPDPEFIGKSKASMYGDFAVMVDAMIGRVLKALKDREMDQNTLVIFTSDNGPVWYDKDVERFGHDSSGGLRGMKADAWEAGHRMPFIVQWPNKIPATSTCDSLISFVDLLATFAELTNKPLPQNAAPDSISFLPQLLNKPNPQPRTNLVLQSGRGHMMVRQGPWKLIDRPGSGGFSKSIKPKSSTRTDQPAGQLYNLAADLSETNNLYEQNPKKVQELIQLLHREQAK